MARHIERVFDPMQPVVARRFFVAAGRHFSPRDPFDWTRMAVALRRVRLLFESGKLMHPEPAFVEPTPPPTQPARVEARSIAPTSAPTIAQETQDEDIAHAAAVAADDDGLDTLNMKQLRAIADAEGAPTRLRREDQRAVIREHRRANTGG